MKIKNNKKNNSNNNNNTTTTTSSCLILLLPVEISSDIFSRLPFDSVSQCKLVCKSWRDILNAGGGFLLRLQPHDVEPTGWLLPHNGESTGFHYGEYNDNNKVPSCFNLTYKPIFKADKCYVIGSCNGLICLCCRQRWSGICTNPFCELPGTHNHDDDMYVSNPYKGEYVKLPKPNQQDLFIVDKAYGFGYHPITKEYKVIRIYYHHGYSYKFGPSTSVHIQVYTLGSDTSAWRNIGEIKHKRIGHGNESENNPWGILLNGLLYWLTDTTDLNWLTDSTTDLNIISFDLASEEFREIPTTLPESSRPCVLGVLNGCLCFITGMFESTRIWVMSNDDYTWIKKFTISGGRNNLNGLYYPLAHLESGKILLHCDLNRLVTYDPKTERILELQKMDKSFDIIPYMKSTVSLKALGERKVIRIYK